MFQAHNAFDAEFLRQRPEQIWPYISPHTFADEQLWLKQLLGQLPSDPDVREQTVARAASLIEKVRSSDDALHMVDALLLQYSLDTHEGILLMCLAEALMRVPDAETADALIRDKISVADWQKHLNKSDSLLVNASTWGLMLTGKVVSLPDQADTSASGVFSRLVTKMGEPVIRQAVNQAMKIMGRHFVLGRTIEEALKNGKPLRQKGFTYSFDMLGESALTADDASRYQQEYLAAIKTVAQAPDIQGSPRPSVSIKLSALHPRYEPAQKERVLTELVDSVLMLIRAARAGNVAITMDAEEQDRHELFLQVFESVYRHQACQGWGGFGLVVQAYGKRALPTLCWLNALAQAQGDSIPVRLVKGAYWDSEIKLCQQNGYEGYPVYTRKEATDVAYQVCARFLLSTEVNNHLYPQFASHNAQTVASILALAAPQSRYEFQRLHGMGDGLYNVVMAQGQQSVRIYAPVGSHKDLLPYLVRRLLENGANSSFVHRLTDARTPVSALVQHPDVLLCQQASLANHRIPLPVDIFAQERANSQGINIDTESGWDSFTEQVDAFREQRWSKGPIIDGQSVREGRAVEVVCPYDHKRIVGSVIWSSEEHTEQALSSASAAFTAWNATAVGDRAQVLERMAELLQENFGELVALCHLEAGKTIHDAIDEVREAVDFCRYYAVQGVDKCSDSLVMPGPTGESNTLQLSGRGVFLCISPWNFPLAIFLGQITAALVAGNTVLAKPAEPTSLIAARAVELLHEAGVPSAVLQLLPGSGAEIGRQVLADKRLAGVTFTGSTKTAAVINRALAAREGAIIPLIAETGGQNAMVVDSTALPEQVVQDVLKSAFGSAGQRCSALRVLYLQSEIADRIIGLLKGAMAELVIGDPSLHMTDVGPVIDAVAQQRLQAHVERMKKEATLLTECVLPDACSEGTFVAPVAFEINSINQLEQEHFGPVLHVVRYQSSELHRVINDINSTGFGLTLGIQSRNETTVDMICAQVKAGNVYVNRNQTGAVVGVQPFGGQGLSGTGPKAGGPHYLYRFMTERTVSVNTTAVGGNASLLSMGNG